MQTLFDLFSELLQAKGDVISIRRASSNAGAILRVAELDISAQNYADDTLYLTNASALAQTPPSLPQNLLCIADAPIPQWLNSAGCNLLCVGSSMTRAAIEDALVHANLLHTTYADAILRITDALYYGQGLQAIADIGAELFGNPVFILDTSFHKLAVSKTVPIKHPLVRAAAAQESLSSDAIYRFKQHGWMDTLRKDGQMAVFSGKETEAYLGAGQGHAWCTCYIKVSGVVVAYLNVFFENAPMMQFHRQWISRLSHLSALELQKSRKYLQAQNAAMESFLADLLEGNITDQLVVIRRAELLGRHLGKHLQVISVRKSAAQSQNFSEIEQKQIQMQFPRSTAVSYCGDIVLLLSGTEDDVLFSKNEAEIDEYLLNSRLVAGCSNIFTNLAELKRYYLQTQIALKFGTQIFSRSNLLLYSDYVIYHALELSTRHADLRDFCHPGILRLRESNDPGDRELYQTLYLYLLYMKNANRVAAEMNIHRSTLFYRLNKVRSKLNIDLDDGNTFFQLMLAFKLEEYMDIFSPAKTPLPLHRKKSAK